MGFTERNSFTNEPVGFNIENMGPVCETRKCTLAAADDVDLIVMERWLDESDECMWLSSDCLSPSSSFFEEHRLSAADDDWLVPWLPTSYESDSSISSLVTLDWDGPETKSSNSSPNSVITTRAAASEAEDLEDFIAAAADDEPLFWPFAPEQDWSSEEAWKCFSMSPRRDMARAESSGQQFPVWKMNPKASCSRNKPVLISSGSSAAAKILELRQRGIGSNNKGVKKTNAMPARLRNLNKVSMELRAVQQLETETYHMMKPTKAKTVISKSLCVDDVALNEELPIETVLGLGEFDGHEGIGLDLNEDVFFLDKSSQFSIKH